MANNRPVIGIDVTSALMQGGGIGRYTRELIQALVRSDKSADYRLFSAHPPETPPVPDPLPEAPNATHCPAPLGERWLYRLWYRARLPLPVQWVTGKLDLFHSPDFVLPPVFGNIPTLLTVHDLSFVHYAGVYPEKLVRYLNSVVPRSVRRATHIVADSAETRNDLITLWGVPPQKITVLYSGVGQEFQPVTRKSELTAVRQKYRIGDKPYLLSVGTVQPRKNYSMLIRAFAAIAHDWPHQLVIAGGKGWLYDDILAEIERQGATGRVQFLGFVDDADLPALYSDAALFLFPSLYEGFGLPLLEAMACGVPCLSSDASCLPEVAGNAAVLLSPHDQEAWSRAIHRLLLDAPRRSELVGLGAVQAHRFTWHRAARELRALYGEMLG
jgi:glycosyltransferase involved in cell wall biosynthesis